ncbi:MAG: TonB-dependent receptor [Bacteroidales bacterium]|nr:TonB-dependent receptor [Bacteroidales bacterium]
MLISFLVSLLPLAGPVDTLQVATITALKESVTLERVAAPYSVIRAERLEKSGTYRPNSLSGQVPGLHIPDYGASLTSTIYMRGLGSRMDNPVLGLYIDGIPVLDKNAYDFDWEGFRSATLLRGPQGTLYGRNAMGGVLALQSLSPANGEQRRVHLEYGSANTVRVGASIVFGNNVLTAGYRHSDGFFQNLAQDAPCDRYDGLTLRWRWERSLSERLYLINLLSANLSREGGFAYGRWQDGTVQPVNYNDEGSYRRLSAIEGTHLRWSGDALTLDGSASLQLLLDDMRMDQDYTPESIFTLRQVEHSGAGTLELRARRTDDQAAWQPQTGFFAMFRLNAVDAPVHFKRTGIQRLILDNANSHIPSDIGYLDIPDQSFVVGSEFLIGTWNAALFHESVYTTGKWQLTAGLRLDYEGGRMDYNCLTTLHYQFLPYMQAAKAFQQPYKGILDHARVELLPKVSILLQACDQVKLYATATRGYRAGGFNTQIFSDILQNMTMNGMMEDLGVYLDRPTVSVGADNTEYDPETAWNFEAGVRVQSGSLKAEANAYYIAIHNQQLTIFPPGKNTGRMMANAARSRSLGAEAQIEWRPGDFRTQLAWSWCDARFVDYHDGHEDYAGKYLPYVPQHTLYANLGYSFHFGDCRLDLDASVRGAGRIYWNEANTLQEPFRPRLDGRIALAFPKWEWYIRGENLTDAPIHGFYFKSMGNEFIARVKPRILVSGINLKF